MKNSVFLVKKIFFFLKNKKLKSKKQIGKKSFFKKIPDSINELNIDKSIKSQIDIIRTRDKKNFRSFFTYNKRKFYLSIDPEKKVN